MNTIKLLMLAFSLCSWTASATVVVGPGAGKNGNATSLQGRTLSATAPTSTQVITWNATTAQWEPAAGGAGGGATYTANQYGLALSDATNATLSILAPDAATTKYLKSGGASANPSWSAIDISTAAVTGVLPTANGGTGRANIYAWSGLFVLNTTNYWSTTSSTYASLTKTGTPSLTEKVNKNFGTVTAIANKPGVTFSAAVTGTLFICVTTNIGINPGASLRTGSYQLIETGGSTQLTAGHFAIQTAFNSQDITLCGYMDLTASNTYSFEVQGRIDGGTLYMGDGTAGTDGGVAFVMHYL